MLTARMHIDCVVCPAGYLMPTLQRNQMPYGASAVSGSNADLPPTPNDLTVTCALGYRFSHVARALLAGRGHRVDRDCVLSFEARHRFEPCFSDTEDPWDSHIGFWPSLRPSTRPSSPSALASATCRKWSFLAHNAADLLDELAYRLPILVTPQGQRPTARRPATTYALTPFADQFLAKPYAAVLSALLQKVKERHGESELTDLLRETGQQLGRERATCVSATSDRARVDSVAEVINELGGVLEVEEQNGQFILTGYSCPLVAVVAVHGQACALTQALIETLLGQGKVQECCDRSGEIRCRFAIDLRASALAQG
jgi:predicted ArsR family transcriptional regulator